MNVLFWNDDPEEGLLLGPFSSVEKTEKEIRVPIDVETMDDDAERFFCEAHLMGCPLITSLQSSKRAGLGNSESLPENGPMRFSRTQRSSETSFSRLPAGQALTIP